MGRQGPEELIPILLADDLTGSCDAGGACLALGARVRCRFADRPGWERVPVSGDVTVLDLETRRLSHAAAVARAGAVGRTLARAGLRPAYFKIDSTLRGHPAAEAEALRRGAARALAWLVPANPAQGRWTIGGRQFVHGRPVDRSAFADDPLQPVRSADVLGLAAGAVGAARVVHLTLHELGRGPAHVAGLRRGWLRAGIRLVVADAISDAHLAQIARCIPASDLPCGAASLVGHILVAARAPRRTARVLSGDRSKTVKATPSRTGPAQQERVLAIIGSQNPLTAEQVRLAGRVRGVTVSRAVPRRGRWWIIACRTWPGAAAVGRLAVAAFRRWRPDAVICSGGETAAAVARALGIESFDLDGEVAPGLIASTARRAAGPPLTFLTKPGGFGTAGALADLVGGGARA